VLLPRSHYRIRDGECVIPLQDGKIDAISMKRNSLQDGTKFPKSLHELSKDQEECTWLKINERFPLLPPPTVTKSSRGSSSHNMTNHTSTRVRSFFLSTKTTGIIALQSLATPACNKGASNVLDYHLAKLSLAWARNTWPLQLHIFMPKPYLCPPPSLLIASNHNTFKKPIGSDIL
jgi:hypothetical protein